MDITNIPKFIPTAGHTIIAFTAEQVATYNIRLFGDKEFVIADWFHPDQNSIEEAVIVSVHENQKELKPGDNVLVDYSIFSSGRWDDGRLRADNNRFVWKNDEYYLYWCYDDMDRWNSCEVLAFIDEKGKIKAFGDAVIVYPHEETEVLIKVVSNLEGFHDYPGAHWALVNASPVKEIEAGQMILCEKGFCIDIQFRGIVMQYINLPYILGTASLSHPMKVKLF